jgi:hypothetical protein
MLGSKLDSKPVIFFNAIAVKQYAIFEESNPKFRNYMEDSIIVIYQFSLIRARLLFRKLSQIAFVWSI